MVFLFMNLRLHMKVGQLDSTSSNSMMIGNLIESVEQQQAEEIINHIAPPSDYNPEDFAVEDEEDDDDFGQEDDDDSEYDDDDEDEELLANVGRRVGNDDSDAALDALLNE
jgi:hypothetical protein